MIIKSILLGIFVYLLFVFAEMGIHLLYFYTTHHFGKSNLLLIKSSLLLNFAPIVSGIIAGYISNNGLQTGFIVGIFAASIILIFQQFSGANPLQQEFTPTILFDDVLIKGCIAVLAGATGELIAKKRNSTM